MKVQVRRRDWDLFTKSVLLVIRDTPHIFTGFSPFDLLYGGKVQGPSWKVLTKL